MDLSRASQYPFFAASESMDPGRASYPSFTAGGPMDPSRASYPSFTAGGPMDPGRASYPSFTAGGPMDPSRASYPSFAAPECSGLPTSMIADIDPSLLRTYSPDVQTDNRPHVSSHGNLDSNPATDDESHTVGRGFSIQWTSDDYYSPAFIPHTDITSHSSTSPVANPPPPMPQQEAVTKQPEPSGFSRFWCCCCRDTPDIDDTKSESYSSSDLGHSADYYSQSIDEAEGLCAATTGQNAERKKGFAQRRQTRADIANARPEENAWLYQSQDYGVVAPWEVHPVKQKLGQLWASCRACCCCRRCGVTTVP